MSEFRRFMSYIYSYRGAEKLKNTGFAKIEARGETCRIEIHIKGAALMSAVQSNVYGFFEDKGLLAGIYLGTFAIKNGMGDVRIITDRNSMGDSGRSLEDLQGIYLTLNEDEENAMASTWDNTKVDTSYFKVFSGEVEEPPFQGEEKKSHRDEGKPEIVEEEQREQLEEEQGEEPEQSSEPELITQENDGAAEAEEVSDQPEQLSETKEEKETDVVQEEGRVQAAEAVLEEQSCACGELNFSVDNLREKQKSGGLKRWKEMLREYPVVNPFDYLDNVEVIKIEPGDISKLEKKYWILANNSFLLHGYCSYRYLILGRNIKENTFFIGIPGVFHQREKMMAGMFGFSNFQMSRSGKLRQGEFGYYIRAVELE